MKRNFIKIPVLALGLILSVATLNSCVKDDEISVTEPTRYTSDDVQSYADLLKYSGLQWIKGIITSMSKRKRRYGLECCIP